MKNHTLLLSCMLLVSTINTAVLAHAPHKTVISSKLVVLTCLLFPACVNYNIVQWIKNNIDPSQVSFLKHANHLSHSIKRATYLYQKRALVPSIATNITRFIVDNTFSPITASTQAIDKMSQVANDPFDRE